MGPPIRSRLLSSTMVSFLRAAPTTRALSSSSAAAASSYASDRLFRTVVPIPPRPDPDLLRRGDALFFIGSCFSDNVGGRAETSGVGPVLRNPFGVQYNSTSIARCLRRVAAGEEYRPEELGRHPDTGEAFSLDHHSRYNEYDEAICLERINGDLRRAREFLAGCAQAYVTLGSAYVFDAVGVAGSVRTASSPPSDLRPVRAVANCHKLHPRVFERRLQCTDEARDDLLSCAASLWSLNPDVRVSFTVSPVRHWKDGPVENGRSKAHLVAACHAAVDALGSGADYFPSYEIVMDELRDYRFYERDMLHPSEDACDYIWERLLDAKFDRRDVNPLMQRVEAVRRAAVHRPFRPESEEHQAFVMRQLNEADTLESEFPWMNLSKERRCLKNT